MPDELVKPIAKTFKLETAFKLRLQGWTYQAIADKLGCSHQNVRQHLESFLTLLKDPEIISTYRDNEADILDAARAKLIRSLIVKADDKKASVNNLAYAFTQVFQASRLIKGESTANVHGLLSIVEQANSEQLGKRTTASSSERSIPQESAILDVKPAHIVVDE